MKTQIVQSLRLKIKRWILLFIVFLVLSGATAFPLEWELAMLADMTQHASGFLKEWISGVYNAIRETNARYPFMSYGTDWLAFAHIVIAIAFIGPLKDPVKNKWVIEFGMIACLMIFPLAFICGPIRGIPFYWQLIDCSFGAIGLIPLYLCYKNIIRLEKITATK